jgi:hypothetical protein
MGRESSDIGRRLRVIRAPHDTPNLIRRKPLKHDRLSLRKRTRRRVSLTICIAALAERGEAIVCVADKMLSVGDYLQWDSDVTKILSIKNTRAMGLIAGQLSHCEDVLNNLSKAGFGDELNDSYIQFGDAYKNAFERFQETDVLFRHGLDRSSYRSLLGTTQVPRVLERIADEMANFADEKWDCDLMICGFDSNSAALIMSCVAPGNVSIQTIEGYHSIGIASEIAKSRLLFSGYKREQPLGRVLFDMLDAKINAEMSTGVGFVWDAYVVYPDGVGMVPEKPLKDLLERAWDHYNLSPFEKWDRNKNLQKPPRQWKQMILDIKKDALEFTPFQDANSAISSIDHSRSEAPAAIAGVTRSER